MAEVWQEESECSLLYGRASFVILADSCRVRGVKFQYKTQEPRAMCEE